VREWFKQAISNPFFISDVFKGMRGAPHFIVSVRTRTRGKPWILRATIDFGEFNHLVELLRIGETGFAFILNAAGQFQTNPSPMSIQMSSSRFLRSNGLAEQSTSITRKSSPHGTETIYAMAPLKGGDWIMVIQQDVADAFSDLRQTQRIVMLIIFAGGLGIVAASLIVSQSSRESHLASG
jgi:two-component system NtrC family sensor kinase